MPRFFSNPGQSFSEFHNVNFYVPGEQLSREGRYSLMAEFYREGQIIARRQLGVFQFRRTKDIRLLVVVENGSNREKPMTHEAWTAVQDALEVLGRRFPVRNGVGPLDGFQSNGLRYRINPDPLSVGFDGGSIVEGAAMEQILDEFNERQAVRQRPDRADHILSVRIAQNPSDAGFGNQQGRLASMVYWPNNPGRFPSLVCQEVGHLFGASVLAPSRHSPNLIISDPSAFDLVNRRAIPSPRVFMAGLPPDPADLPDFYASDCMFEVPDWNAVRLALDPGQ